MFIPKLEWCSSTCKLIKRSRKFLHNFVIFSFHFGKTRSLNNIELVVKHKYWYHDVLSVFYAKKWSFHSGNFPKSSTEYFPAWEKPEILSNCLQILFKLLSFVCREFSQLLETKNIPGCKSVAKIPWKVFCFEQNRNLISPQLHEISHSEQLAFYGRNCTNALLTFLLLCLQRKILPITTVWRWVKFFSSTIANVSKIWGHDYRKSSKIVIKLSLATNVDTSTAR